MVVVATVVAGVSMLARFHESILVRTILVDRAHVVVLFAELTVFPMLAWGKRQTSMDVLSPFRSDDDDCGRLRWNATRNGPDHMGVRSMEYSEC